MKIILDIYEYNEYMDDEDERRLKEYLRDLIPELEFNDIDLTYEMDRDDE